MTAVPFLMLIGFTMGFPDAAPGRKTPFRGMTVSCQGYGRIWGTDTFVAELDRLKSMGVNSIAIHPYARIHGDGTVTWRWSPENPPEYITRPIQEARKRGLTIMIKPHLAYWGGPFSWRGDIHFKDLDEKQRFFQQYKLWIVLMARVARHADLFAVATELKADVFTRSQWREIIAAVRIETNASLTLASNWDDFENVDFWDDLDMVGIQGYFPITRKPNPGDDALLGGWDLIVQRLIKTYKKYRRPIIFTEFGYNRSLTAAARPWDHEQDSSEEAESFQARCLEIGLNRLGRERDWFYGVFLWKWFAGPTRRENFYLDTPKLRNVIVRSWRPETYLLLEPSQE